MPAIEDRAEAIRKVDELIAALIPHREELMQGLDALSDAALKKDHLQCKLAASCISIVIVMMDLTEQETRNG